MTVNRTTFLNALLSLHAAGGYREIPEDALNHLFASMAMASDDAVTMVNDAQKDGLVHLRWRGFVTLTEKGRTVAEGRDEPPARTAVPGVPAPKADAGNDLRLDRSAGLFFGAAQAIHPDGEFKKDIKAVKSAAAALGTETAKANPDKPTVKGLMKRLQTAIGKINGHPAVVEQLAAPLKVIEDASGTINTWIEAA